jgi:GT2 family glycosyltransferase
MAAGLPGLPVLGFLACGAIVRRDAFLAAGGFHRRYGIGGEEELLALDLAEAGWALRYCPEVVAHHHPDAGRDPRPRRAIQARNALWTAWLRRRPGSALRRTCAAVLASFSDRAVRSGLRQASGGIPWVLRERRAVSPRLEDACRRLE